MKRVEQLGEALAVGAVRERTEELAARCREQLSAEVTIDGADVVMTGQHLLRQWLQNAELRSLGRRL